MTLTQEMQLVHALQAQGIPCSVFEGLTTRDERREKVRATIKRMGEPGEWVKLFETAYAVEF